MSEEFFYDFYDLLFKRCAELSKVKANTDDFAGQFSRIKDMFKLESRDEQYWLLREAIDLLLNFSIEPTAGPVLLSRVAESHYNRKISPQLYNIFVATLLKTVKKHDKQCSERRKEILRAWKEAVKPGIRFLKKYQPSSFKFVDTDLGVLQTGSSVSITAAATLMPTVPRQKHRSTSRKGPYRTQPNTK